MAETLSLGGREYERIEIGPVRQDLFVMMQARHAGLTDAQYREGETLEAYSERLLASILSSGRALLLIGGLVVEKGKKPTDWDEEMAHRTAGHLGSIVDLDEKKKLYAEIASTIVGFFAHGLGSWIASRRSSGNAGEPEKQTAASADTASGRPSSTSSEGSTSKSASA